MWPTGELFVFRILSRAPGVLTSAIGGANCGGFCLGQVRDNLVNTKEDGRLVPMVQERSTRVVIFRSGQQQQHDDGRQQRQQQ